MRRGKLHQTKGSLSTHPCSLPSFERRTFLEECSWEGVRKVFWVCWM